MVAGAKRVTMPELEQQWDDLELALADEHTIDPETADLRKALGI